ncbi:glycosyltransferase family 4 protein [Adhaeribacter radiodurans]|uniref:Glycosyltransferase family 4 protein n=1 Tax=Adhaeribacter radiodurans TaxID=2745197 RepID=A0A7L7L8Q1_9BACT|nr:glycosyltransferase family 4 protein [Adhaeribacter radiodurans]QMU29212.1 glycosyltransferase family 4 protein [Adhaeribacter radiodurans]
MTADTIGGVWTYTIELVRALGPERAEVALATMGAPISVTQREEFKSLANATLFESSFKLEWMDNPWKEVDAAANWLMQIKEEFKPDLIHLNNLVHGHLNWRKPVILVVHSCVQSWWQNVKKEKAPDYWQEYQKRVTLSLQAAHLVVAPTLAMLEEAETFYGPFQNHLVVHNGRDLNLFRYQPKEPFIFSMGRVWDEAKNIKLLTEIAPQLSWPVIVAGDAKHPSTGEILDLPNVKFVGYLGQSEIADYLSRASIFALPAKYEPFGLSALEAGLSGCALILGDIPSQKEIWQHAATYVNPEDADQLLATLNKLISDEFIRNIFSFRAIKVGLQFSAKQMAFDYEQVYQQLLEEVDIN